MAQETFGCNPCSRGSLTSRKENKSEESHCIRNPITGENDSWGINIDRLNYNQRYHFFQDTFCDEVFNKNEYPCDIAAVLSL